MAEEKLIKSTSRVRSHGEVFTPNKIVKLMLEQSGLRESTESLTTTFLEPAAGEGAFLTEILKRKLKIAVTLSDSISEFEQNALLALTSLYGIELLVDNTELLVINMYHMFYRFYNVELDKYEQPENNKVINSAKIIISANMVQGDAVSGLNREEEPLIFSEWRVLKSKSPVKRIQRTEYTFDSILNDGPSLDGRVKGHGVEEISLFDLDDEDDKRLALGYAPCRIFDI